jgi:hypothetical protein
MALAVPVGDGRPAVRAFRARVSAHTVAKLLARAGADGHLTAGGARVTVKLPVSHLTADLAVTAPGNGRLRIEATALSLANRLPVPGWMIGLALGRLEKRPGIHRVGNRTVEVDMRELLGGTRVAVRWQAGIRAVRVTAESAEIECS